MKKQVLLFILPVLFFLNAFGQQQTLPATHQWADVSAAIGAGEGTAAFSYVYNFGVGKKRKLDLGAGLRLTGYSGHQKKFYTAPGKYARSTTTPFAIVFAGHEEKNLDTLTLANPFTAALNFSINAGYHLGDRWYLGVNIDLVGFTFGSRTHGVLQSNGMKTTEPRAKPSGINLLLTGDNDYGSLNSELFLRYRIDLRWQIKAVYQFAFSEYSTETIHQTAPDGNAVFRFRNKANLLGLGIVYCW